MFQCKNQNLRVQAVQRSPTKAGIGQGASSRPTRSRGKNKTQGVAAAAKIPPEKNDLACETRKREGKESGELILIDSRLY